MRKVKQDLAIIKLVGITARTNNALEKTPELAKIGKTLQRYFGEGVAEKVNMRKNPGKIWLLLFVFKKIQANTYIKSTEG